MSVVVCRADEIGEGCARGFIVGEARLDVVVIRRGGVLRAYMNSCPHQGTPLETFPDRFLDQNGLLVCSTHGARFRVDGGYCVSGPCAGKALRAVVCVVEDGVISVDLR